MEWHTMLHVFIDFVWVGYRFYNVYELWLFSFLATDKLRGFIFFVVVHAAHGQVRPSTCLMSNGILTNVTQQSTDNTRRVWLQNVAFTGQGQIGQLISHFSFYIGSLFCLFKTFCFSTARPAPPLHLSECYHTLFLALSLAHNSDDIPFLAAQHMTSLVVPC